MYITDLDRIELVAKMYATLLKDKADIEREEKALRSKLTKYTKEHGQFVAEGLKFDLTQASETVSYPRADVEKFIMKLIDDGYMPLAQQLRAIAKTSRREGGLRVTKVKQ